MNDLTLDLGDFIVPEPEPEQTIGERFQAFHEQNQWVAVALTSLAMKAKSDGRTRVGMKHLVEVLRWTYGERTNGSEFRFDNSYTSRYARLIAAEHPELADLFETRRLRAA